MSDDAEQISPCKFPNCRDADGNPRLTRRPFCTSCERRYRKLLDWITLDYATIKHNLPKPTPPPGENLTPRGSKIFGHPAEWASIAAAEIANWLNWTEDHIRDVLGHEPPPHPGVDEARRVAHAYRYLTTPAAFEALCTFYDADGIAVEANDLHWKVRRALGFTRATQHLPTPCPFCDVAALVRDVGQVECRECGHVVEEKLYPWLTGWIIDRLIDQYDTRKTSLLA